MTLPLFLRLCKRRDERDKLANYRAGVIAETLANANRNPETRPDPYHWTDFFPAYKEPEPEMTEDDMLSVFDSWARVSERGSGI